MATKLQLICTVWLALSSIIVIIDAGYILLRPHTFEGGSYFWFYWPYANYAAVDKSYGLAGFENNDGFVVAQSVMNLVEVVVTVGGSDVDACRNISCA